MLEEKPNNILLLDFDAVVVASGDFPTHPVPLGILAKARHIVACDSAGEALFVHGFAPEAVIGDCDSMSAAFRSEHSDIVCKVDEQDYNDLTKATRFCIERGWRRIVYVGCTGRREDHTLGNISLMSFYHTQLGVNPVMLTDYGTFVPARGVATFRSFARQQVSIFNISCTRLEGKGLRWQPYAYRQMWQGTLNEALGEEFTLQGDGEYIVYMTHEAK